MNIYLSEQGRQNIHNHKYSCVDNSLLSRYVFPRWWNFVLSLIPRSIAPNCITLFGLVFVLVAAEVLAWATPGYVYEDGIKTKVAFLIHGVFLFIYQTLDAVDGKQARRTGSGSPLGELFDHAIDSVVTIFTAMSLCSVVLTGTSYHYLICIALFVLGFYQTTLDEYFSGRLFLGYFSTVTEGMIIVILALLITPFIGKDLMTSSTWFSCGLSLPIFLMYAVIGIFCLLLIPGFHKMGRNSQERKGKSYFYPCALLIPPFFATICFVLFVVASPDVVVQCPRMLSISYGLNIAYLSCVLMVNHISETDFKVFQPIALASLFLPLSFILGIDQYFSLGIYFTFMICCIVFFFLQTAEEFSRELGISVLSIIPKECCEQEQEQEKEKEKEEEEEQEKEKLE